MKVSFGILCHDEDESLRTLLQNIVDKHGDYDYEIVIVYDPPEVENYGTTLILGEFQENYEFTKVFEHHLNDDYATQKNFMTEKCSGDWIINPDADELLPEYLLHNFQLIAEQNNVDLIWVPRVNIVTGLTQEWVAKWHWDVNDHGWVNWPDYQARIYKKDYPKLHWENKVHEKVVGYERYTMLPSKIEYAEFVALKHIKSIERQINQNKHYEEIIKEN